MKQDNDSNKDSQSLVSYLLKQNKSLKDELQDAKEMVKINKVEMDILTKDSPNSKYIEVICNYRTICESNQRRIQLLERTVEALNSEKLILNQLNLDATSELSARQELHRDRIVEMQQIIQDLQTKLSQLDKKQLSYDGLTGFVERNIEIFNPTEQMLSFKKREDVLHEALDLLNIQKSKLKQSQDSLVNINGILRHKLVTIQAKLAMPNKNLGQVLDESLKRLMMYFIETQKRLLTGQEQQSDGDQDLQLIAPELKMFFGEQATRRQKNYNVPHVDLLKIRGTIINGNQVIDEDLKKRNTNITLQQKVDRLKIQLVFTRRQLTKTIVQLRQEIDRRQILQRICEQLETRNQMLLQSNKRLSDKMNKYLTQIRESKQKQMQLTQIDDSPTSPSKVHIQHNNVKQLQINTKKGRPAELITQNYSNFNTLEQYKIHLELLAKDLQKNTKIQHLELMKKKKEQEEQNGKNRFRRSNSNPFLYLNEQREGTMQDNPKIENIRNTMRLQTTQFSKPVKILGSGQYLDYVNI